MHRPYNSQHEMQFQAEDPGIIYRVADPAERGSSAWYRPIEEGTIIRTGPNDGMCGARHLGGNRCQRLALEIGIVAITDDIALILNSKAVVALTDGDLRGNPECGP